MKTTTMKMKLYILIFSFICGFLNGYAIEIDVGAAEFVGAIKNLPEETASSTMAAENDAKPSTVVKDKRQVGAKDTQLYPNHRRVTAEDDPEDGQETIYGPKPNQFLIRPMLPPQTHQQPDQEHQQPTTQLRNYPVTIRPHSQHLLEQSQEIQHFAYLQDLNRNHPKATAAAAPPRSDKLQPLKAIPATRSAPPAQRPTATTSGTEEAEQRYAYTVQTQLPQPHSRHFKPSIPYQIAAAAPQQLQAQAHPQQQQQQQHQQYQVIPEEQFLKLIEEELQARAYQEAQPRYQPQKQQPQQRQYSPRLVPSHLNSINKIHPSDLADGSVPVGLGNYRQRISEEPNGGSIQYIPSHQGGPKYLPLPNSQQHPPADEPSTAPVPPRLVRFKPTHLTYKSSLPNHPLAKSSLEKEIEKLLAANRPSADALQNVDHANEPPPAGLINQHHQQSSPARHQSKPILRRKPVYSGGITTATSTLVDANNQPFVPSLFQFNHYQQPAFIHPNQQNAPNLGPVVYPTAQRASQPAQPSQFYYQEAPPTPSVRRPYRSKQYSTKAISAGSGAGLKVTRPKEATKLQPYGYEPDLEPESHLQTGPIQFYNNAPDPSENKAESRPASPTPPQLPSNYSPFPLPAAAPSQSSIYVSQGTGITTPSHRIRKPSKKTAEDVRQLKLPPPGGKPLTQAEFQALLDAGYPVTAVPVPVPVPYEQYIRENPEHRSQTADFPLLNSLAQQYASSPGHRHSAQHDPRTVAAPSEPSVQFIASPSHPKEASATGAEGVTYLRPIKQKQHRHPRDEKESAVDGHKKEAQ